jgi:hypothetical protein
MKYHELIQAYFERSVALQWYWTVYVLVIGGVLGFSTFRQRPERVTTVLVTILYAGFAWKNLGAIEATAEEREAILSAIKVFPASGPNEADIQRVREKLEPTLAPYDIAGARYFHLACDLLTIAFLWAKEWRRRRPEPTAVAGNELRRTTV